MAMRNKVAVASLSFALGAATVGISTPVLASDAGAFIGGVLATKVLGNMRDRTEAEQQQAAASQQMAAQQRSASSSSGGGSAEARIAELDKLAAGGYITPAEYKSKKKAILDSM
jgi:hypothetical protein